MSLLLALLASVAGAATDAPEADAPPVRDGTWIARDVRFASGEALPEVRLHYRTLGALRRDADGRAGNAVLILHGTGGSGAQFLQPQFAGELFGPGQPLDATRHFLILPDALGHGASSKPSDGLRRRFPRYGYDDMVALQHRLLVEGLGVDHLRRVLGTSMGGMHAWIWGYAHPRFADGIVPLAAAPAPIVGRNRVWRKALMDAIRDDPAWRGGDYVEPPRLGLRGALRLLVLMGAAPIHWQGLLPSREAADAFLDEQLERPLTAVDANDMIYQFDASRDYDPTPHLGRIVVPVLAINSADDQVNPPELGLVEAALPRVARGSFVLLPASERTRGHSSHTWAALWRDRLTGFLAALPGPHAAPETEAAGSPPAQGGDAAAQIEAAERALIAAIGGRDLAAYDRLVADDYVAIRPDGERSKAQVMADYRASALAYRGLAIDEVTVRPWGDVCVVSARTLGSRIEQGRESPNRVRYIRVWARRGSAWRAVLRWPCRWGRSPRRLRQPASRRARTASSTGSAGRSCMRPVSERRTATRAPTGAQSAGSVGPKSASVGAPKAAARWLTPESFPTNVPARASRAPSALAESPEATAPAWRTSGALASSSAGPDTSSQGRPGDAAAARARKRSAGQFLRAEPLPGCSARNGSGRRLRSGAAASSEAASGTSDGSSSGIAAPSAASGRARCHEACSTPCGSGSWTTTRQPAKARASPAERE
jgi:homoserine O-acetyltransferase